jgi:hypothetical protein
VVKLSLVWLAPSFSVLILSPSLRFQIRT